MILKIPAHMKSYRDLVDGSANISFGTPELTDEDILVLRRFRSEAGWLLFAPNPLQEEDIPKETAEVSQKTPSARLRAILFVYWNQLGKPDTFDLWYNKTMEKFINSVKVKLDAEED
jgi:hypothetical protein